MSLQGDYHGTCIVCLRSTDSVLACSGEPEWHAEFLVNLGIPEKQAFAMIETYGEPLDAVYKVCED